MISRLRLQLAAANRRIAHLSKHDAEERRPIVQDSPVVSAPIKVEVKSPIRRAHQWTTWKGDGAQIVPSTVIPARPELPRNWSTDEPHTASVFPASRSTPRSAADVTKHERSTAATTVETNKGLSVVKDGRSKQGDSRVKPFRPPSGSKEGLDTGDKSGVETSHTDYDGGHDATMLLTPTREATNSADDVLPAASQPGVSVGRFMNGYDAASLLTRQSATSLRLEDEQS